MKSKKIKRNRMKPVAIQGNQMKSKEIKGDQRKFRRSKDDPLWRESGRWSLWNICCPAPSCDPCRMCLSFCGLLSAGSGPQMPPRCPIDPGSLTEASRTHVKWWPRIFSVLRTWVQHLLRKSKESKGNHSKHRTSKGTRRNTTETQRKAKDNKGK